ncbi:hypothetical protein [Nannocystis punicea]|uniref:Uncharacterized protein n=1 Tax=Nannocystis punicea TaxID=2995304 RepID=A0ABY7HFS3_9BACT|nr:hypothetical protein [Nannocystis poenicansa]WAS98136.1 hypothetical protein O0S08_18510 [Nannocystis poenicansa]
MSSLIDCPECACLFRASDATCPFCGHTQRHSLGSTWAAVAFTASLGAFGAACQVDRDLGDETSATAGDQTSTSTGDTADTANTAVDTSKPTESTDPGGETIDPTITTNSSDGATYAGPDEDWDTWGDTTTTTTTTDTSTTTNTTPGTTTTTTNATNDSSDASTYAGPDETWGTSDSTTSTSDASTYAGPDTDTF